MSYYDRDAAMDQLAEWEEEKAMEAYYEKQLGEAWSSEEYSQPQTDVVFVPLVPKLAWPEDNPVKTEGCECASRGRSEGSNADISVSYSEKYEPKVGQRAFAQSSRLTPTSEGDLRSPEEFVEVSEETIQQKIIKDTEDQIRELMRQNIPINVDMCVNIRNKSKEKFKKTNKLDITFCELPNVFG